MFPRKLFSPLGQLHFFAASFLDLWNLPLSHFPPSFLFLVYFLLHLHPFIFFTISSPTFVLGGGWRLGCQVCALRHHPPSPPRRSAIRHCQCGLPGPLSLSPSLPSALDSGLSPSDLTSETVLAIGYTSHGQST